MPHNLEIVAGTSSSYDEIMRDAIASNFARASIFSINESGHINGTLDENAILFGLTGLNRGTILIFGVSYKDREFYLQSNKCSIETVVNKIKELLEGLPGKNKATYRAFNENDVHCYVIQVAWDRRLIESFQFRFPDFENPFARQKDDRFDIKEPRSPFSSDSLRNGALDRYLDLRKVHDQHSLDLRVPADELAAFLGLESTNYHATGQAKAAFGNNDTVESAIYVRQNYGPYLSRHDFTKLVDRTSNTTIKDIETATVGVFDDHEPERAIRKFHRGPNKAYGIYKIGGTIFNALENIDATVSDPAEIFRNDLLKPANFSQNVFASALKELVLNAYIHGSWKSGYDHTRDDKHSWRFGNSVAIAHLGNRIETVNKQELKITRSGIRRMNGTFDKGINSIHLALKDIGLAQCRNFGLKNVRNKISKIGLPSPIIINDIEHFRVVFPLQDEFCKLIVPNTNSSEDEICITKYFVLKLFTLLGELNEMSLSSILQISIKECSRILHELSLDGFCTRKANADIFGSYIHRIPYYSLSEPSKASDAAEELIKGMTSYPAPELISPGTLLSLSRSSMWLLVKDDYKRYVWKHFKNEGVYGSRVDALADKYFMMISDNRRSLGDGYA
ncbi:MAG: hypothetical protein ABIV36_00800 [Sphingobium limneticum]